MTREATEFATRFEMAKSHAEKQLRNAGWTLDPSKDYDIAFFWRIHEVPVAKNDIAIHQVQLFDFLKSTQHDGPEHFVIAWDVTTQAYYLRSDLRSTTNLEALPPSPSKQQ